MNGIILYQSKYGATKRYAQWLAEETGFPCVRVKEARISQVRQYDTVLLGGGVYASGIAGLSFLKKHLDALEGKRVLVFCVGASPYDQEAVEAAIAHNLKGGLEGIPCFYCRGAWDMDAMSLADRTLCRMLQKAVAKKDPAECQPWERALLEAGSGKCDWADRKYLAPILEALRG